ncbi:hypothetical protein MJO29_013817 [Puccinia striiformis f. sp. tritici]|uniref:Chromo domain-containing protein n=1 Tax=Puccinia striiformis f. sp. tritici PST-78 TaxID=1165861 RepID=A0A0L0W0S7_9BASI|nr:hypothetical protein Pst134EA_025526 [Puccinia striiformis f. sp. tritici]KAH9443762.1 hypothetical protein Pst134EB_026155 [Puccinia striiformis f. sp. tritici]KAH9451578.1 hypothetical protein Pst134EA_025526 [Puccinia striiformis f. sp. tritici]KAI7941743.1 hypothetical protein MJO29_013817 [Puccinia striiformis f. sp. tritici]KNF05062.1 hypothetical protein PSTG_01693 [Puccinia striiformis f. sp. tritici PST-78]
MSSKGKHNSTASTYSSNKKRREHGLSPSSDGQPESVAQASPGEKSKKSSKSSKPPQEANSNDKEEDDDAPDKEEVFEVETIKSHLKKGGKLQDYVSWKGYKSNQDAWEPKKSLEKGAAKGMWISAFR